METDFQKRKTIRHQSKQCYLIQIKNRDDRNH